VNSLNTTLASFSPRFSGTYWLFVGIVLIGLVFMVVCVPETRGVKLEEVETLFSKPLCSCSREDRYQQESKET